MGAPAYMGRKVLEWLYTTGGPPPRPPPHPKMNIVRKAKFKREIIWGIRKFFGPFLVHKFLPPPPPPAPPSSSNISVHMGYPCSSCMQVDQRHLRIFENLAFSLIFLVSYGVFLAHHLVTGDTTTPMGTHVVVECPC